MNKMKAIRGIDEALYRQARVASIQSKVTLGEWLNRAIRYYLGGVK